MNIKQKMYVIECGDNVELISYKPTTSSLAVLCEVEVEVDFNMPSDIQIRDKRIASIKNEIEQVRASAEITTERLLGDIQRLMALEVNA